jgi:hypothetical protein
MEKEGMTVNWSDIILSVTQAEAVGKRIGAERQAVWTSSTGFSA